MGFLGDIMKNVNYLAVKGKQGLTSLGNLATSGLRNMHKQHEAGLKAIKDRPNLIKEGTEAWRHTMKDINKNTMLALGRSEKEAEEGGQFAQDQAEAQYVNSLPGTITRGVTTAINVADGDRKLDWDAALEMGNAIPNPFGLLMRGAQAAGRVASATARTARRFTGNAPNPLTPILRPINNNVVQPVIRGAQRLSEPIKKGAERIDHDLKFKHPNIRKAGEYAIKTGHVGNIRRGIINTRREEEKKKAVDQRRGRHRVENPDSFPTRTGASMDRTEQSIVHAA